MKYRLVKESELSTPIVPLNEAKAHLRVDNDAEDGLITSYIEAATAALDGPNGLLKRSVKAKTYLMLMEEYPAGTDMQLRLPLPPLTLVDQVFVQKVSGPHIVPGDGWSFISGDESLLYPESMWPAVEGELARFPFRIRYSAGYTAGQLPPLIKQAILIHVGHMYANREAVVTGTAMPMPLAYQEIIDALRVFAA
jgi:uncharacterized phiE125 gp8 family phage protein